MKINRQSLTTIFCLLLTWLVAGPAGAQPMADRIPQDALLYIGWAGAQHMPAGYADSHLKGALEASEFPKLIEQSLPALMKKLGQGDRRREEMHAILAALGAPAWRHPTAFYYGGIDLAGNQPLPKLAILCDAGQEGKALAAQVDALLQKAPPQIPLRVEEADGLVVFTVGSADVSPKRKPPVALSQRKEFTSAMAQAGKDPIAAIYLDGEGIIEQVDQLINGFGQAEGREKWLAIKDATGIAGLKRIIWTGSFENKQWASHTFVESPEPRSAFVRVLIDAKPLSKETLATIPSTATMAAAGHFDFGMLFSEIRAAVKKIDAVASAGFEERLETIKNELGLDLQGDVFDSLGDEWAVYSDPTIGGSGILGLTGVNRLKDPAKAEKALLKLEELLNRLAKEEFGRRGQTVAFATVKRGDLTIHYLAVPFVSPSWAIKDGILYVGLYPQVVAGAVEHVASKGKSILDNPDFAAMRKQLGDKEFTAIAYSDLPPLTVDHYQEVLMLTRAWLGLADVAGAQTPALTMPTLPKLLPHVTPAAGVAWVDKEGWHSKSLAPFPGSNLLAAGGLGTVVAAAEAILLGTAVPEIGRARARAMENHAASNLRQIGQAITLYSNDNKGKFPGTLGELLLTQDVLPDIFIAAGPDGRMEMPVTKNKEELAAWINQNGAYTYLGAGKQNAFGPEVIIAYEKSRPNQMMVNVLFGDGHVESMPSYRAQELINKQNAPKP